MAFAYLSSCIAILLTTLITLNYAGTYFMTSLGHEAKQRTGVVSFPLTARPHQLPITRRDDYADIQLFHNATQVAYFIQLSIGTPQQDVMAKIATSESSLWVSVACDTRYIDSTCDPSYGNYNPQSSTTSSHATGSSTINYFDGGVVSVNYYMDTYALSTGTVVQDVKFGVTNSTAYLNGLLGLGFARSDDPSPTIIAQLASMRITNSKAFSLALSNSSATNGGVVIFGGVDTKKFSGSLSVNHIANGARDYTINMDGMGVRALGDDSVTNFTASSATVTINSGFGSSYLPNATIESLAKYFNASVNDKLNGRYGLSCSMAADSSSFVTFSFGSVTIEIPFSAFAYQIEDDLCDWTLQSNAWNGGNSLLGVQFLQYAYTVFDQTTMTVSLAQYANCGTNVQEIQSYGAANFVGECSPARVVTPASNSSSMPSNPTPDSPSSPPSGLSSGAKAGIGVGAAVGVIAVAALAYFMLVARRRREANTVRGSQNLPPHEPYPDKIEQPRPEAGLHEMYAEQGPGAYYNSSSLRPMTSTHQTLINEAPGSLHNEQTAYAWGQSAKWAGHGHPTTILSELPDGAREAGITRHEIGEHP
ncbi:aspartic peptidase domain-containing protein [Nemania sp. FL0031]|nr:aspartic peptidase domain-containing protein [Nemania sp. FL0031]